MLTESPDADALQAELNGLIYAISHDLRAPARAITGFTHVLREHLQTQLGSPLQGDTHRFLERIEAAVQHLHQMLDGLLTLSRLTQQPLHLQPVLLKPLCQSLIKPLQVEPRFTVELDMDDQLQADADPALLKVALNALLDNAQKFANLAATPLIRVQGSQDAEHVTLCVFDNGVGFDMQYAARLGIPFQHLHANPALKGLGLGLATARRIAARHAGNLLADSNQAEGTRFSLRWPLHSAPPT